MSASFTTSFRVYEIGNGVFGAEEWVAVETDADGEAYPNGGYYRSLGSYATKEAADRAVTARQHAVFARTATGDRVRVSDALDWNGAQREWSSLDAARRARQFPHVRHFEVRSMIDPGYADAPVSLTHSQPVIPTRGFKNACDAARRAWRMWQGETTPHGTTQGTGGWFYWHNGRPAAQGISSVTTICERRGLIVRGADGHFYPLVSEL